MKYLAMVFWIAYCGLWACGWGMLNQGRWLAALACFIPVAAACILFDRRFGVKNPPPGDLVGW